MPNNSWLKTVWISLAIATVAITMFFLGGLQQMDFSREEMILFLVVAAVCIAIAMVAVSLAKGRGLSYAPIAHK